MVRNYLKIIPGEGALAGQCWPNAGFGTAVAVSYRKLTIVQRLISGG
jgi:hypothetical protein